MKLTGYICILCMFVIGCSTHDSPFKRHALVYGVSQYEYSLFELPYSASDADSVAYMLDKWGYEVTARTDSVVTPQRIKEDIAQLSAVMSDNDMCLFFFSGHGIARDALSHLDVAPENINFSYAFLANSTSPVTSLEGYLKSGTVSKKILVNELKRLPTRNITMILDMCYAGGFIHKTPDYNADHSAEYIRKQKPRKNTSSILTQTWRTFWDASYNGEYDSRFAPLVLGASGSKEISWDGFFGQSVFTYFFLRAPCYGDFDENGRVTLIETYAFIRAAMQRYWNKEEVDSAWNFIPHLSGGGVDVVLFDDASTTFNPLQP